MLFLAGLASGLLCAILIVLLKPLLVRYALARPNARSSHREPTPQGGGIAVLAACLSMTFLFAPALGAWSGALAAVAAAAASLALLGAADDIRPLPALPRLVLQFAVVAGVVAAAEIRILPDSIPLLVERLLLVLAGTWFVNLVNFMDGLDWITVAEMVPVTAFIAALGALGTVSPATGLVAAALCGALLGFAPFNRPVASLFLGDVGSLPIGLLAGWLLLELAGTGAIAAAILLPLYHLADATMTLLKRLARGERVTQAHRSHFYQKATDHGFSALAVSGTVFVLNLALAALAALSLTWPEPAARPRRLAPASSSSP